MSSRIWGNGSSGTSQLYLIRDISGGECRFWLPCSYYAYPIITVGWLQRGVKKQGRDINHQLHLAPRLKKEYRYTSITHRDFMACLRVNV
jgi:hypothetical protein